MVRRRRWRQVAYLIEGHGTYTWAKDLPTCRRHIEALEFLFQCLWLEKFGHTVIDASAFTRARTRILRMSQLRIRSAAQPDAIELDTTTREEIASQLQAQGVRFEQWPTQVAVRPGAEPETVIAAYRADIDRLMAEEGYQTVDVVSLASDNPAKEELRKKVFIRAHPHRRRSAFLRSWTRFI